jgi:hypothetical protein
METGGELEVEGGGGGGRWPAAEGAVLEDGATWGARGWRGEDEDQQGF